MMKTDNLFNDSVQKFKNAAKTMHFKLNIYEPSNVRFAKYQNGELSVEIEWEKVNNIDDKQLV